MHHNFTFTFCEHRQPVPEVSHISFSLCRGQKLFTQLVPWMLARLKSKIYKLLQQYWCRPDNRFKKTVRNVSVVCVKWDSAFRIKKRSSTRNHQTQSGFSFRHIYGTLHDVHHRSCPHQNFYLRRSSRKSITFIKIPSLFTIFS